MKPFISSLEQSIFKEKGILTWEDLPFLKSIQEEGERVYQKREKEDPSSFSAGRDLFRDSPRLKKELLSKVAPLLLELTSKKRGRLLADQIFPRGEEKTSCLLSFFSFDSPLCLIQVDGKELHIYHPSMPAHNLRGYWALFGLPESRFIENTKDPASSSAKKRGYAFGDSLKNEDFPLFFQV